AAPRRPHRLHRLRLPLPRPLRPRQPPRPPRHRRPGRPPHRHPHLPSRHLPLTFDPVANSTPPPAPPALLRRPLRRRDLPALQIHLRTDGPGSACTARSYDGHTRRLLAPRRSARPSPERLEGDDLIHFAAWL